MSLAKHSEKIFTWFGEKVSPAFVSASIAGAKGVFRPIFTMLDKKQDKDSKTYAAIREGLTEVIAIPVYLASGAIAAKIAQKKATPKGMTKDVFKNIIKDENFNIKSLKETTFERLQENDLNTLRKNFFKMKGTMSMLGVFASALIVIPLLCSLTIKPLMKGLQPKKAAETTPLQKAKEVNFKQNSLNNPYYNINRRHSSSLKVGAL